MPAWLKKMSLSVRILGFYAVLQAQLASGMTVTGSVSATDGKRCLVYLHVNRKASMPPLVVSQQGTGIYTTAQEQNLEPALRKLLRRKRIAVLTLDKPGVGPSDENKQVPSIIDSDYERYTQADLTACAQNALQWAAAASPVMLSDDIYFSGHSEGAQVLTRLYRDLLLRESVLAQRVKMLVLSGLPMVDWRVMLDAQLSSKQKSRFWGAYGSRDNSALRPFGGLTFQYLESVFAQESLRSTFEQLWALGGRASFRVFQGTRDRNTHVDPVRDFELANAKRALGGKAALDLEARYYDAGHALNPSAIRDIARVIEQGLHHNSKPESAR